MAQAFTNFGNTVFIDNTPKTLGKGSYGSKLLNTISVKCSEEFSLAMSIEGTYCIVLKNLKANRHSIGEIAFFRLSHGYVVHPIS